LPVSSNLAETIFTSNAYSEAMNNPPMRETDWQKTLEVVVKGLVGAVLALAGLWLLGWLFSALGALLLGIAGLIGGLLRFLIPVAAIAGIVYFIVAQLRPKPPMYTTSSPSGPSDGDDLAGVAVLAPKPDKPDLNAAKAPLEPKTEDLRAKPSPSSVVQPEVIKVVVDDATLEPSSDAKPER
jgi:hypothetical protein